MTFGGAPSVVRLRQSQPTPNGRFGIFMVAVLAYTFAGFGVYWLVTGAWTVGVGGTLSNLGGLVWIAPLVIGFPAILLIGDRGAFRVFYLPRSIVTVDADGLAWWTASSGAGRLPWADLGGVSRLSARYHTIETVFTLSGEEVASIQGPFRVEGRSGSVSLPTVILGARPQGYLPVDPRHPERGCLTLHPRGPD